LQHVARPSLADLMDLDQMRHSFPLPNGRHHFLELMSRSMALSNICSVSSFLSLPFSSSSACNRFASDDRQEGGVKAALTDNGPQRIN